MIKNVRNKGKVLKFKIKFKTYRINSKIEKFTSDWGELRFVLITAKFGICPVVGLTGTLVEAKIRILDTWMCIF